MSGTIPTLVYYGIVFISPNWFYVVAFLVCTATSLTIGSSWTTAGTIGVGLVGLSTLIGVSPEITAGAVISGAYVGDKTSPLSETTVLAAQLNGVDLYKHIRAQAWTTVPAGVIAMVVFLILGLNQDTSFDNLFITEELEKFERLFWISPWNLIPLAVLLFFSIRKVPPTLAILGTSLLAGVMAVFLQPDAVGRFVSDTHTSSFVIAVKGIWLAMATGFEANSGIPQMDALLSRGGMDSMLLTIWLIIGAVAFGTLVDEFGLLNKLITPVLTRARTRARLFMSVVATALGLNIATGDQYIALLLPTSLFRAEFKKRGLAPENLSRALGDAGIVTSPLVPWNSCGAYMAAVLGVTTMAYMPFALFNIFAPILTLAFGITGFKIVQLNKQDTAAPADSISDK
jgi:NhaC family Na+:H+ antiporter